MAAKDIAPLSIEIQDEVPRTVSDIENSCNGQNYDLIFVDYLQLIDREEDGIEEVVKALRKLTNRLRSTGLEKIKEEHSMMFSSILSMKKVCPIKKCILAAI